MHAEQPHPGGAIASSDTPPVSSLLSLSLLCGLAPASLTPLFPTPESAPFSVFYCGFYPAAVALQRFLHALTNSHLSPLAPTPEGAPFSVFYCGFSPAAVALSASSTR